MKKSAVFLMFLPHVCFILDASPLPPANFFIERVGETHTPPPPCRPSRAQPRSWFSLLLSFIWPHPFSARIKEPGALWVGSVQIRVPSPLCVCCGRDGFMLPPTHFQKLFKTPFLCAELPAERVCFTENTTKRNAEPSAVIAAAGFTRSRIP